MCFVKFNTIPLHDILYRYKFLESSNHEKIWVFQKFHFYLINMEHNNQDQNEIQ